MGVVHVEGAKSMGVAHVCIKHVKYSKHFNFKMIFNEGVSVFEEVYN